MRWREFWLWRAVNQHGMVFEEILQKRRNRRAAKRLMMALMGAPIRPKI